MPYNGYNVGLMRQSARLVSNQSRSITMIPFLLHASWSGVSLDIRICSSWLGSEPLCLMLCPTGFNSFRILCSVV